MVTNHLRASYGVYCTKNRTILRRPSAAGIIVLFFCQYLDIILCPVKLSYCLKFHGACMAFCRVIEGTMTSAGHRLHTWDGHRTIFVEIQIEQFQRRPGIVRCVKRARNFPKSLNKSADARSVELPPVRSDVYLQKYILNLYRYFTCEDQKLKLNYVSLEELRINNMQRMQLLKCLQSWASVVFTSIAVRVSISVSYFNNLFFGGMMANFDIIVYFIARDNVFHPC